MGIFRRLLGGKPPVPHISDEAAVVDWFLKHDDTIADLRRNFASRLRETQQEFVADLTRTGTSAAALKAQLDNITKFYSEILLPSVASRRQRGGPIPGETHEEALEAVFLEAVVAAKIRVFGYVLQQKFGIQPE